MEIIRCKREETLCACVREDKDSAWGESTRGFTAALKLLWQPQEIEVLYVEFRYVLSIRGIYCKISSLLLFWDGYCCTFRFKVLLLCVLIAVAGEFEWQSLELQFWVLQHLSACHFSLCSLFYLSLGNSIDLIHKQNNIYIYIVIFLCNLNC